MTNTIQSAITPIIETWSLRKRLGVFNNFAGVLLLAAISVSEPQASAQALPAAEASPISTGFSLPKVAGSLQYAISASESLTWGYYQNSGAAASTNISGDVAYISDSKRDPFSMVFAGGRSWSTSGQPSFTFMNLGLSQVLNAGRWTFVFSDNLSYMPSTPTTGLSGIPGVGDLGINPVQVGVDTGLGVLTNYSRRVYNTVSASAQRQLTGKTSANASGYYSITRFLNSSGSSSSLGLDSDSKSGQGGLSHQFDERNTMGGMYSYSRYDFANFGTLNSTPNFVSQTASMQYTHLFTRKLSLSASAGPQFTKLQGQTSSSSSTSMGLFADVSGRYTSRFSSASLGYVRSTNSGYGVLGGALTDSIIFSSGTTFARVWAGALSTSYSRTSSLPLPGVSSYDVNTVVASAQVSRAIAKSLSGYASFTVQDQNNHGIGTAINSYSGVSQVLGFGVTYSPTSIRVGRP